MPEVSAQAYRLFCLPSPTVNSTKTPPKSYLSSCLPHELCLNLFLDFYAQCLSKEKYIRLANLSISANPTPSDQSPKHGMPTSEPSSLYKRVPLPFQRSLVWCPPQAVFWHSECLPRISAQAYRILCYRFHGIFVLPETRSNVCHSHEICVDVFPGHHMFEFARCISKERYVRIAQLMLERSARANLETGAAEVTASGPSRAAWT